jgi:hypothetical protein
MADPNVSTRRNTSFRRFTNRRRTFRNLPNSYRYNRRAKPPLGTLKTIRPPENLPFFSLRSNIPSRRGSHNTEDALMNHNVITAFASVIGKRDVNDVIHCLSEEYVRASVSIKSRSFAAKGKSPHEVSFYDEASKLAPFEMIEDSVSKKSSARSGRRELNVLAPQNPAEKGSFGVIYRSEDGKRIYKSITIDADLPERKARTLAFFSKKEQKEKLEKFLEEKIRNIFVETFIQTVLACDPDVGQYICRPLHLFRDPKTVGEDADPSTRMTFFILMEPIKYTISSYIDSKGGVTIDWFSPFLGQLGFILDVLKRKYNYSHRDLHTGNVMVTDRGDIKLIDFGYSCLEFRGQHYHELNADDLYSPEIEGCNPGSDLGIFFTHFFFRFDIDADPKVKQIFSRKYLGYHPDKKDATRIASLIGYVEGKARGGPAHFPLYYFKIDDATKEIVDSIDILKPHLLRQIAPTLL